MNARRPEPPPEAALIQAALRRSRLSARQAAKEAGLSDARWRQITSGYQSVAGEKIAVHAPPDTLARMAHVVGITADELTEADRSDAATSLQELGEAPPPADASRYASDPHIDAIAALLATLPPEAQDEVLRRAGRQPGEATTEGATTEHRRAG
ncbi:hypothetical protein ABZ820_12885 [Streptomyces diacarni]|uniref:hypothetical protein n=1 Tax=Streptomyces diacarni TaxID=2800381 RepID=UPI003402223A